MYVFLILYVDKIKAGGDVGKNSTFNFALACDTPPSSLLDPRRVQMCQKAEVVGTWCRS
jgi:hypothetical protein